MSDAGVVFVEPQWVAAAAKGPVVEPPLSAARVRALDTSDRVPDPGLMLAVPGVVGLLTLRGGAPQAPLGNAVSSVLGLEPPTRLAYTEADGRRLRWMSPDEWLLSCAPAETTDIEARLRAELGEAPRVSITEVSAAWCVLELGGRDVRAVLSRGVPIDVDPAVFPPGRTASTVFAKAGATISNLGEERYEVICRRSLADYIARWIASAARGHGLRVQAGTD